MKKKYFTPETLVFSVVNELSILTSSDVTTIREDNGGPHDDEGFPTDIGNTSTTPDPYGGHGQDGNTTRSKESFDIWDDTGW